MDYITPSPTPPRRGVHNVPINTTMLSLSNSITKGSGHANITLNSPSGAFTSVINGNTLTATSNPP